MYFTIKKLMPSAEKDGYPDPRVIDFKIFERETTFSSLTCPAGCSVTCSVATSEAGNAIRRKLSEKEKQSLEYISKIRGTPDPNCSTRLGSRNTLNRILIFLVRSHSPKQQ